MSVPARTATIGPLEAFWRYRRRTVPACVLVALAAAVAAFAAGGASTATTSIYLTDPRGVPIFRDGTTAPTDLETYTRQRADFAASDTVLGLISSSLGGGLTVDDLRDIIETGTSNSSSITVTCTDTDDEQVVEICRAVSASYVDLSRADTARRAAVALESLRDTRQELVDALLAQSPGAVPTSGSIEEIDVQIAQTSLKAALFDAGVEFVDAPVVSTTSRLAPVVQYGLAAFVFAFLVATTLAWVAAVRRPIVDDPETAAAELGAPLLGRVGSGVDATSPEVLATNLASVGTRGVMVVTSADERVVNAESVASIAEAWTREGRAVLLVDGNLRRPRLSARFGAGLASVGFTDLLAGLATEDAAIRKIQLANGPRMSFVPCGQAVEHASSLLRSATAEAVLARLRQQYDVVLVDAPPMMDRAEGAALASVADGIVMVLPSESPSTVLTGLRRRLDVLGVPLVGVVVADREG